MLRIFALSLVVFLISHTAVDASVCKRLMRVAAESFERPTNERTGEPVSNIEWAQRFRTSRAGRAFMLGTLIGLIGIGRIVSSPDDFASEYRGRGVLIYFEFDEIDPDIQEFRIEIETDDNPIALHY